MPTRSPSPSPRLARAVVPLLAAAAGLLAPGPAGHGPRARTVAHRVARLPVWAFHGLRDDIADPCDSKDVVGAIVVERERLGLDPGDARLTPYPDANHNGWDAAVAPAGGLAR